MKVIVLGRDGVINQQRVDGAVTADNFVPVAGSMAAIARLNHAGFRVVIATNQQDLSRGALSVEELHDVHQKLLNLASETGSHIDGIFFAPTGNPDGRGGRQPKAALLEQISARYRVPTEELIVVGDARDLEAAAKVGAQAILLSSDDDTALPKKFAGTALYPDLTSAVEAIVKSTGQ